MEKRRLKLTTTKMKASAIFETKDKQLIPLDDIQHINARYNEAMKDTHQMLTIMYRDGMKVTVSSTEYDALKRAWEARRNNK